MTSRQLTFDGTPHEPRTPPRGGCIGKVQRLLEERHWLTCGEIAEALHEPSRRVSECLNKLKHEGRAQFEEGLGQHRRTVWAGTSETGYAVREARRAEVIAASDEEMGRLASTRLSRSFLRAGAGVAPLDC